MDLDAIIARRPQIVLVDELAHTNAEGSRHPKRYLDVEELMSHGIDVYTTVNIQHIESLNDVVAQITHVRVRETVPDAVFDRADAVELVDLTPDDLIAAAQGRQGLRSQTGRARAGTFLLAGQPHRAARTRLAPHRRAGGRAIALGNAGACDPGPMGGRRAHPGLHQRGSARRRAGALRQTARRPPARSVDRALRRGPAQPAARAKRNATASPIRCGSPRRSAAKPSRLPSGDRNIAEDVIGYAQANNVTQIIIGKSTRTRWFEILHGSVVHDLVRRPAISACMSSPATPLPASRYRRSRPVRPSATKPSTQSPICFRWWRWRSRSAPRNWSIPGSASRTSIWFF